MTIGDHVSVDPLLRKWRDLLGELTYTAIELEQPFFVQAEREEWAEWAAKVLARADAATFQTRLGEFGEFDDSDEYLSSYVREIDALSARLRTAMGVPSG